MQYIKEPAEEDLKSLLVFVGGPRQVGKTLFALSLFTQADESSPAYLNRDDTMVRAALLKEEPPADERRIVLNGRHNQM